MHRLVNEDLCCSEQAATWTLWEKKMSSLRVIFLQRRESLSTLSTLAAGNAFLEMVVFSWMDADSRNGGLLFATLLCLSLLKSPHVNLFNIHLEPATVNSARPEPFKNKKAFRRTRCELLRTVWSVGDISSDLWCVHLITSLQFCLEQTAYLADDISSSSTEYVQMATDSTIKDQKFKTRCQDQQELIWHLLLTAVNN